MVLIGREELHPTYQCEDVAVWRLTRRPLLATAGDGGAGWGRAGAKRAREASNGGSGLPYEEGP